MRGHNIRFHSGIRKIIWSSVQGQHNLASFQILSECGDCLLDINLGKNYFLETVNGFLYTAAKINVISLGLNYFLRFWTIKVH